MYSLGVQEASAPEIGSGIRASTQGLFFFFRSLVFFYPYTQDFRFLYLSVRTRIHCFYHTLMLSH